MSPNDHEDQEFDDFLQGKGELAQQLKSLSQPQPSEAQTQAILARVQRDLERPEAANAPSFSGVARPGWIRRMRVPLTLAASVTLGIAATMLWRDTVAPGNPLTAQAPVPAPAPAANGQPEQIAAAPAAAATATPSTPQRPVPVPPAAPPTVLAQTEPPVIDNNAIVMRSVPAPETGPDTPPQAWLSIIAKLIQQDQRDEALRQWDKFRQAHPQYAVPDAVQAQIDALKK